MRVEEGYLRQALSPIPSLLRRRPLFRLPLAVSGFVAGSEGPLVLRSPRGTPEAEMTILLHLDHARWRFGLEALLSSDAPSDLSRREFSSDGRQNERRRNDCNKNDPHRMLLLRMHGPRHAYCVKDQYGAYMRLGRCRCALSREFYSEFTQKAKELG